MYIIFYLLQLCEVAGAEFFCYVGNGFLFEGAIFLEPDEFAVRHLYLSICHNKNLKFFHCNSKHMKNMYFRF